MGMNGNIWEELMGVILNLENCRLGLVAEKHLATCSLLKQPDLISSEFNANSFEPTGYIIFDLYY